MGKKIYITSLHMMHGGIEMAITLLANALVKRNYDVEILCTYNLGEPVYKLDDKVKITYLTDVRPNKKEIKEAIKEKKVIRLLKEGLSALNVLYQKKQTMKQAIQEITDGCIIATRNDHAVLLSQYGQSGVKKIAQLHHDHQFEKRIVHDFKTNYTNIDVFVLLTEWLKIEIEEIMKDNHHTKHVVIPNFLSDIESVEKRERENQVIAVGRMHEVKGFLRMLDVWKNTKTTEKFVLKIVGDGDEFEKVKQRIEELGLVNRVILTGALNHTNVMKEMQKSKAYLMTSYTEAFPFVLIEAMSSGLPIVAYDVRVGPRAMITENENGNLILDGDEEAFSKKLETILNNEAIFEKMSRSSLNKATCFTEDVVIKQWIEVLES